MLKIAAICKQKRLALLLDNCCCCADVFVQYCRIDIFHCCLEVIVGHGLTLQTWSLTHPHRKKLQRLQSGECRGQETSNVTKQFFLLWAGSWWFRSNEQLHLLVDLFKLTWPVTDELISARPDYDQIIKGICDINADLPASSTIHFTTSPFLSMSQTNSCHHYAIPPSQICLLVFGTLWHPGDIISLILGLGEDDTISHHFQKPAQGISARKWWQFWALFDIRVDLKLVSIKLIFILC